MASDAPQKQPDAKRTAGILLACSAAAVSCLQLTRGSEGLVLFPRADPVGITTGCYGETEQIEMRAYTPDECGAKLRKRLEYSYAPRLASCLPELTLEGRAHVFGAYLDAAYNAGPDAVCKSRMAVGLRAGNMVAACNFNGWFVTARDRRTGQRVQLRGLVVRRQKESVLCRS